MNLERFREKVRYYRPLTERTQKELANAIGLTQYVLSHRLQGTGNARLTQGEVKGMVKTWVEGGAMTRQAEARELLELMECPDFLPDEWNAPPFKWLESTTSARSGTLSTTASPDVEQAVPVQQSSATRPLAHQSSQDAMASPPLRRDWGEAIDVTAFYGRERELVELERWIVDERCRLVPLLSRGGYVKTPLSVKLTQQIERHFDFVIWRSLQNAPRWSACWPTTSRSSLSSTRLTFPRARVSALLSCLSTCATLVACWRWIMSKRSSKLGRIEQGMKPMAHSSNG